MPGPLVEHVRDVDPGRLIPLDVGWESVTSLETTVVRREDGGGLDHVPIDSTGDGPDNNLADNLCDDGSGRCTLRAAIQQAKAIPGGDTIKFGIGASGSSQTVIARLSTWPTRWDDRLFALAEATDAAILSTLSSRA